MPWLKVSDDLASKLETTRIPRAARPAALGLWVLAGSWCAQQLTDGHFPAHMLDELAGTEESAGWLVSSGFWAERPDGWQFLEWEEQQPMRAATLEQRRKNTEKVSNWRKGQRESNSVTNSVSDLEVTPPPSRPDPTRPNNKEHVQRAAHDYSEEFEEWWSMYPRKQGKAEAQKAYQAARKQTAAAKLLAGAQAYALLNVETEKTFLKLPAGWLRGERWNDDQIPAAQNVTKITSRTTPTDRALQTLSLGAQTDDPVYCPEHPFYPVTSWAPCAACARELPEGANF